MAHTLEELCQGPRGRIELRLTLAIAVLSEVALVAGIILVNLALRTLGGTPCILYFGPNYWCPMNTVDVRGLDLGVCLLVISAIGFLSAILLFRRNIPTSGAPK